MTREEKISKAAYSQYCNSESICFTMMCDSFKQGAKWADEHPKSPWISVKEDLPCNHSDLVLTYNDIPFLTKRVMVVTYIHTLFLCEMKKDDECGWIWNYPTKDIITHWFPIPELPK